MSSVLCLRASIVLAGLLLALPALAKSNEAESFVQARLTQPLTMDDAVRVALLNNRNLRALYYRATLSEGAMPDGILAADRQPAASGDPLSAERRFILAATAPLARPYASAPERRNAERLRADVAGDMLRMAHATRRAYVSAVAAQETAHYLERALESAEAGKELARRMVAVGNWPRLNELRERAFHGELAAQLARARQAAVAERERLTELFGLWGDAAQYRLPERLPDLPPNVVDLPQVEELALRQRLDLHAARLGLQVDANEWELDGFDSGELLVYRRGDAVLPESDLFGVSGGRPRDVRVPLFDREQARRDPKLFPYVQSLDRYNEAAVAARAEARMAYLGYRTAYDVARHYRDTIIPLRKEISDENLLRYNGMFISVFELLADAREQIASVTSYIAAQREFWLAEIDLRQALSVGGRATGANAPVGLPSGAPAGGH